LAPDEPVMDMSALAPEEEVVSLDALAPDEPVMDMSALAPEEEVVSLDALAPDEPVMDMSALAPEEEVVDLAALAPEPGAAAPVMDLASLASASAAGLAATGLVASLPAREVHPYDEPVFDLDSLAPAHLRTGVPAPPESVPSVPPEEAVDITLLTPDDDDAIVIDLDALRPEGPALAVPEVPPAEAAPVAPSASTTPDEDGEPVYTRTLAELYASQGASKQAVTVLRHLLAANPSDQELTSRIAELEAGAASVVSAHLEVEEEEEVETLARDLAESGAGGHEVHSPFAWAEELETAKAAGPTMREYFEGLLNWEPREGA
jgi:hypothetical protein